MNASISSWTIDSQIQVTRRRTSTSPSSAAVHSRVVHVLLLLIATMALADLLILLGSAR